LRPVFFSIHFILHSFSYISLVSSGHSLTPSVCSNTLLSVCSFTTSTVCISCRTLQSPASSPRLPPLRPDLRPPQQLQLLQPAPSHPSVRRAEREKPDRSRPTVIPVRGR
ncbi:hypothetical protein PFISCL1PPCAC_8800, partial [Pristionchus fissidentatus]